MASRSILNCVKQGFKNHALLVNLNKLNHFSLATNSNGITQLNKINPNQMIQRSIHLSSRLNESITIESPAYAESIKEGDITFMKKAGESVNADEVVAKIETDKTTIEIYAPKAGVIEQLLVEDGSTIAAHCPIIKLSAGGAASSAPVAAAAPTPAPAAKPEPKVVAPAAQTTAPATLPPVPPLPRAPVATTQVSQVPVTPLKHQTVAAADPNKISGSRAETKVKMSKMRKTVATRLKDAQNTTAMLTTFNEINMGNLVELRKTYGEQFVKKHNLKLGFMSAFLKSAATALQDQPVVNAVIENNEIVYRDYVDISVAVATPKGLVVPVVRNVERMSYADIEKEIAALGEKARSNKLAIEDMQGGTFTISNGGVFGSLFGTPIINLPQSAILGMHGVFDRPVVVNGQIVIRPMMYVALTYDHRLIDGREAVTFLRKIKSTVEDPRTLLLDI